MLGQRLGSVEYLQSLANLSYRDENITVSLDKIYVKDDVLYAEIVLTVINDQLIIRPNTYKKIFNDNDLLVGEIPQGIKIIDNFKNSLGLLDIEPRHYGHDSEIGVRPNQNQRYTIQCNPPLKNTTILHLAVGKEVFDTPEPFYFTIPKTTVIYYSP